MLKNISYQFQNNMLPKKHIVDRNLETVKIIGCKK